MLLQFVAMVDADDESYRDRDNRDDSDSPVEPLTAASDATAEERYSDRSGDQDEPEALYSPGSEGSMPLSSGSAPLSDTSPPGSAVSTSSQTTPASVPDTPEIPRTPRLQKKKSVHFNDKTRRVLPRTRVQNVVRVLSLYLVPLGLAIPTSLLLSLTTTILTPLYNTYPLTLHTPLLYGLFTLILVSTYWLFTTGGQARDRVSARVCLNISALAGDAVVVAGRTVGSVCGLLGPQWGALTARMVLGLGIVGGVGGFSLLCMEHAFVIPPARSKVRSTVNLFIIAIRSIIYVAHIYLLDRLWSRLLAGSPWFLIQSPEKSVLCISLLLTAMSLLFQSPAGPTSFASSLHQLISTRFKLSQRTSRNLAKFTSLSPSQIFPILLLFRIPLLILALRQQLFLRPHPPYVAASGTLRVLSSERGITGQIVVAENLERNYRFMRCDASILGGKWIRQVSDGNNNTVTVMGESIFAAFPMQEIGTLAYRSDASESLMRTIALTTDLLVIPEVEQEEENKPSERALIIGLGIGVTASSFAKRGLSLDIVELDPVVYRAAVDHFDLVNATEDDTINLIDGSAYVSELSQINVEMEGGLQKWAYVVHDCFTGGGVPGDVYTKEFWDELRELVEDDGIVAVNVAGVVGSLASRAIIVTLLSVFTQCRAFNEPSREKTELMNMVIFCTMTHSPLLTFRPPAHTDIQRSRIRSHVYTTFHQNEVALDSLIHASDWNDTRLLLSRNSTHSLEDCQGETNFAAWRAMQNLLSREMWMAW